MGFLQDADEAVHAEQLKKEADKAKAEEAKAKAEESKAAEKRHEENKQQGMI